MSGECAYSLNTRQIFVCLMQRHLWQLILAPCLVLFCIAGWVAWRYLTGFMDETTMTYGLVAAVVADAAVWGALVGLLYARARRWPADRTELGWGPFGLTVKTDQQMQAYSWSDVRWRQEKDLGLYLSFPDGRFTLVPREEVSESDRADLRGFLEQKPGATVR